MTGVTASFSTATVQFHLYLSNLAALYPVCSRANKSLKDVGWRPARRQRPRRMGRLPPAWFWIMILICQHAGCGSCCKQQQCFIIVLVGFFNPEHTFLAKSAQESGIFLSSTIPSHQSFVFVRRHKKRPILRCLLCCDPAAAFLEMIVPAWWNEPCQELHADYGASSSDRSLCTNIF